MATNPLTNGTITPPRVPLIDPRTGQIDRTWFLFFYNLFNGSADNTSIIEGLLQRPELSDAQSAADAAVASVEQALQPIDLSVLETRLSALEQDPPVSVTGFATSADLAQHIADTTTHGTTGDIVGTTDTQTLTNKTLGSPVVTGVTDLQGGRIQFPATQVPSSDPNTLDDYEEGSWTPTVTAATGSITSYTASGVYTKVGRVVTATARVEIITVGTATDSMIVTLPFTAASETFVGSGREFVNTGRMVCVYSVGATASVIRYDNVSIFGNGNIVAFTLVYHV